MSAMVPDEMYVLFRHRGSVGRFPDSEEVDWVKMDNDYYIGEPGPRFTYKRQGEDVRIFAIPSDEAWQKFMDRLNEIEVFSWKSVTLPKEETEGRIGYVPRIWKIEIKRPGKKTFECKGPIDKLPPNFDKFCEALSELMGGQRFGEDV